MITALTLDFLAVPKGLLIMVDAKIAGRALDTWVAQNEQLLSLVILRAGSVARTHLRSGHP